MTTLSLGKLQDDVDQWIIKHGGYWSDFQIMARLTEELGEVSSALQRKNGLRPRKEQVNLSDEVGDLLFTLAAFANINKLELAECVKQSIEKYNRRDFKQ